MQSNWWIDLWVYWSPTETATLLTSKWGALICIDSATGDIARTTTGWIEDEKYWVYVDFWASTWTTEFDTWVKMTWNKTVKLDVSVNASSYPKIMTQPTASSLTMSELLKNIPIKSNTKYKISIPVKAIVSWSWIYIANVEYNSSWTRTLNGSSPRYTWTINEVLTYEFTSQSSSTFLSIWIWYWATWIWTLSIDWNWMNIEEVVETINNTLTNKSIWLLWFTANWTYDNIVEAWYLTQTAFIWSCYTWNNQSIRLLNNSKTKITWIDVHSQVTWSPWDITCKVYLWNTDYTTTIAWTILAQSIVTQANLVNNWYTRFNTPIIWTVWASYLFHFEWSWSVWNEFKISWNSTASTTPNLAVYSIWTLVNSWNSEANCKVLYYKPCTNLQASLNWDKIDLRADSDWFLDWAKIDLENWTVEYWDLINTTWSWTTINESYTGRDIRKFTSYHSASVVTFESWSTFNCIRPTWLWWAIEWYIIKLQWFKFNNISIINFINNVTNTQVLWLAYSLDWITYTDFWVVQEWINTINSINVNWATTVYISLYRHPTSSWDIRITKCAISATIDTTSIKTLYNYPTNKIISDVYSKVLSTATTTAIYRRTKFWFPAIEFSNWEYVLLKVNCEDTTSVVKFSADWNTYTTVVDWWSIAITSTTIPIVYTQITIPKNRLLLSSNDYNADWTKDWSNCQTVKYVNKSQGLIYDIQDLQKEINLLKS